MLRQLGIPRRRFAHIEQDIAAVEAEYDDDAESIITNERYIYIAQLMKSCCRKEQPEDEHLRQNRPHCHKSGARAADFRGCDVHCLLHPVTTVSTWATDWANDGVFGDGWHLFGIGSAAYEEGGAYTRHAAVIEAFEVAAEEAGVEPAEAADIVTTALVYRRRRQRRGGVSHRFCGIRGALATEPDPADGVFIPGIPVLVGGLLERAGVAPWLDGLIMDGIVGGVGAVLGFVPPDAGAVFITRIS